MCAYCQEKCILQKMCVLPNSVCLFLHVICNLQSPNTTTNNDHTTNTTNNKHQHHNKHHHQQPQVFSAWPWAPTPIPITLRPIEDDPRLNLPIWDARRNPRDAAHIMPIITPCYPCMNSSYNVMNATLDIMLGEFRRGSQLCTTLMMVGEPQWSLLAEPVPFFHQYKNYLQVGLVESVVPRMCCV